MAQGTCRLKTECLTVQHRLKSGFNSWYTIFVIDPNVIAVRKYALLLFVALK
jgi:hypothetical protein